MSGIRACLPREHGLWCWAGAPLIGAVAASPSAGTGLAAISLLLLFASANAARAGAPQPAQIAGGLSALSGLVAALALPGRWIWLLAWAGVTLGTLAALRAAGSRIGTRIPDHTRYELAAIIGCAAAGAAITIAGGGSPAQAAARAGVLVTWELIGLRWVRGRLARVLPDRRPWREGARWIAGSWAVSVGLAWAADLPWLAAIPALYPLRIALTAPVASPKDARRVGLSEAAWTLAALAALLAGCR